MAANYDSVFIDAVNRVLAHEGGYVLLASDPGGETKFGISKRTYPDLDIRSLTRDDAIAIYHRDFWLKFGINRIRRELAPKLFDLAVNIGADHAVKCLQRAVRAYGSTMVEDGVIGDATVNAVNSCANPAAVLAALRSEAAGYYRTIAAIARGPRENGDREFLEGWLKRAYS
jgi:lysozyme family protein